MSNTLLLTKNLTKDYGSGRGALDIDLEINKGEIVGFLGPNGAGKSTTMRMIMQFAERDSGEVQIFGKQIGGMNDIVDIVSQIGFLPGEPKFYKNIKGRELFQYAEKLYQKPIMKQVNELADLLELDLSRRLKDLSMGNKKKVGVIHAFMHSPKLLILDEPTNGLDPLVQQKVLELILKVKDNGGAVFVSSHVLSEVERVCDRIMMIKDAKIIFSDTKENIRKDSPKKIIIPDHREAVKNIPIGENDEKNESGNNIIIYTKDPEPIIKYLVQNNIYNFYIEMVSLEELFLKRYE